MIFSDFRITTSGNQILIKNYNAIVNVDSIKFYKVNNSENSNFSKIEFRWSFNTIYWSSWELLKQSNFNRINIGNNTSLFFEIRYIKISANVGSVSSFEVHYDKVGVITKIISTPTVIPEKTDPVVPKKYQEPTQEAIIAKVTPTPVESAPLIGIDPSRNIVEININEPKYTSTADTKATSAFSGKIVNADTLENKDGSYYLWRPHHKGTQSIKTIAGLQKFLNNLANGIQNAINGSTHGSIHGFTYEAVDPSLDYLQFTPLVGDTSIIYTGDDVTQIVTENIIGTKIIDFTYDVNGDVLQIDISTYGEATRVITFERDLEDNIIAIHTV